MQRSFGAKNAPQEDNWSFAKLPIIGLSWMCCPEWKTRSGFSSLGMDRAEARKAHNQQMRDSPVLKRGTDSQNQALAALHSIFRPRGIHFTLIDGAACREYGLSRAAKDLDIVVSPYNEAMVVISESGQFLLDRHDPDVTNRTCTQTHLPTGVPVDFLTGGIRINEHCYVNGGIVHDIVAIPKPKDFGDILPLISLIAMKISVVISSQKSLELGKQIRAPEKLEQDIRDVESLVSICNLQKTLVLGDAALEERYRQIYESRREAP